MYEAVEGRFDLKKAQAKHGWVIKRVPCYAAEVLLSDLIPEIFPQSCRERSTIWLGGLPLATATEKGN